MKRLLCLCLAVVLMFCTYGCFPEWFDSQSLKFKAVEGGYALYRYKSDSQKTSFIVPDTFKGQRVVEIMDFAIANAEYIKTLTIGENISVIGQWGIVNCACLEEISVSPNNKSFTTLDGALYSKDFSEILAYPNGRYRVKRAEGGNIVGGGVLVLPEGVKKIGNNAFYQCQNLWKIEFNEGLTEIGDKAFMKCSNLTNFILPQTVEKIGSDAFSYCDSLTQVTIPAAVNHIGDFAFYSLSSKLDIITVKRENFDGMYLGKQWLPVLEGGINKKCEVVFKP